MEIYGMQKDLEAFEQGGIFTEILGGVTYRPAPLSDADAGKMLDVNPLIIRGSGRSRSMRWWSSKGNSAVEGNNIMGMGQRQAYCCFKALK